VPTADGKGGEFETDFLNAVGDEQKERGKLQKLWYQKPMDFTKKCQ